MTNTKESIGLSTYEKLKRVSDQIRPGMYRYQIERLFPRSNGGVQGPFITIYNEYPGGRVEVPFDRTGGGTGYLENRVAGLAKIYVAVP